MAHMMKKELESTIHKETLKINVGEKYYFEVIFLQDIEFLLLFSSQAEVLLPLTSSR